MRLVVAGLLATALPALAQEPAQVASAQGAVLRGLDKTSGQTTDYNLRRGESAGLGRLTFTLDECRYPADDPASNAYAHLTIRDEGAAEPVFSGWMIAAAPALSALDHPRYDVWVIRCSNPGG